MNIQRYTLLNEGRMDPDSDGDWIYHTDHIAALEAVKATVLEQAAKIIDEMMLCGVGADILMPRGNSGNRIGLGYAAAIRALVPSPALEANQQPDDDDNRPRYSPSRLRVEIARAVKATQLEQSDYAQRILTESTAKDQVIETLRAALTDREALGERIYRAMYEHKGGDWRFNETKDVWFDIADRFIALTSPTQEEVK